MPLEYLHVENIRLRSFSSPYSNKGLEEIVSPIGAQSETPQKDNTLKTMNSGQRKTLAAIFAAPVPKNLVWADIESLFVALGCEIYEGRGSRVAFLRDGKKADFHRPHPGKEAKPYQIRDAREFLIRLGEKP